MVSVTRWMRRRRMNVVQKFGKGAREGALRLTLCDTNAEMTDAWLDQFFGVEGVEIVQGDLLDASGDAVVSPANSFGDMSGGVDKRIDDFFQGAAQERITQAIREQFMGELPVGMAIVVPMLDSRIPFVAAAPTMRVPQPVSDSLNAYLAMRAALVAVLRHNAHTPQQSIRSLAVPGLCTGVGAMPYAVAARQMRIAYDNILSEGWKQVEHPALAPLAFNTKTMTWRNTP